MRNPKPLLISGGWFAPPTGNQRRIGEPAFTRKIRLELIEKLLVAAAVAIEPAPGVPREAGYTAAPGVSTEHREFFPGQALSRKRPYRPEQSKTLF